MSKAPIATIPRDWDLETVKIDDKFQKAQKKIMISLKYETHILNRHVFRISERLRSRNYSASGSYFMENFEHMSYIHMGSFLMILPMISLFM